MARYEFAIPKASVGDRHKVMVWEDGDLVRIVVASDEENLAVAPRPVAVAAPDNAGLGQTPRNSTISGKTRLEEIHQEGSWSSGGVVLPPETELSFSYDDESYYGMVNDGDLFFGEEARSRSPSGAMMSAIRAQTGKVVNVNGWNYIEALLPGTDEPVVLGSLRSSVNKRTRQG